MLKLDFVVPGFSKCGTTTLCALLAEHPEIFVAKGKEPSFFADRFDKGWPWYEQFFRDAHSGQLRGEGSTYYSSAEYAEISCRRILECSPDCRFIFIARSPIARLESSFREQHSSGYKYGVNADYSIGKTLLKWPNMLADTMYWKLLNVFRQQVSDERILVLFLEDFKQNPDLQLRRCFEFLGVDPSAQISRLGAKLNSGASKRYDSRLMRYIRTHRWTSKPWNRLGTRHQDLLSYWLRLRKPFTKQIAWDPATVAFVREQVEQDATEFLRYCDKPITFWNLVPASTPRLLQRQAA